MTSRQTKKIPPQPMPKLSIEKRRTSFEEVALGYDWETAVLEAARCLQCKDAPCIGGCPADIDIPLFIRYIQEDNPAEAIRVIKEKNNLPAVCGRVCPQEDQCQKACLLNKLGKPINIGWLERFASDYELTHGISIPKISESNGRHIAVVGSGPAGLTAAADLARDGFDVTLFEGLHEFGGVLMYGIPEFRLPKKIVRVEVDYIGKLGVRLEKDTLIGRTITIEELFEDGYDAVFVGTGAGTPRMLRIKGENLNGIYSANEFLIRVNLMSAYEFPEWDTPVMRGERVAVIGGGNVAMDSARSALRCGRKVCEDNEVTVIYRRTEKEMPARDDEIVNAREEGVKFIFLATPVEFSGNEQGWVRRATCIRMKLGEPDESGRCRPIPIEDGGFIDVDIDSAIIAIGQLSNRILLEATPNLKTTKWNTIEVNPETYETSIKNVYAGGDIVEGAATVISAIGGGKRSAASIANNIS
ncbi:MAG: NADPH-dependent glutamate synthase [Candidatus Hodarchaeota archaeon]